MAVSSSHLDISSWYYVTDTHGLSQTEKSRELFFTKTTTNKTETTNNDCGGRRVHISVRYVSRPQGLE